MSDDHILSAAADRLLELEYRPWQFGDSIAFEAMVAASRRLGQTRWRDFAHGFFRCWAASHGEFTRMDCTAPGLGMLEVYEDTGDVRVLAAVRQLADYLVTRPRIDDAFVTSDRALLRQPLSGEELSRADQELVARSPAAVYIDCLHFDPPLLTALGRITGEADYVDEGVRQARAYIELLQDRETGLFHHYRLEGMPTPYILGWGRGQGWALLGLVDVLRALPRKHPHWADLAGAVRRLVDAMRQRQLEDGSWHTLVDDAASGAESSTAAFMETGMRRAVELDVVPYDDVELTIERARKAAVGSVQNGVLRHASDAVLSSPVRSHYAHVPTDVVSPWSQGALVLALASD